MSCGTVLASLLLRFLEIFIISTPLKLLMIEILSKTVILSPNFDESKLFDEMLVLEGLLIP